MKTYRVNWLQWSKDRTSLESQSKELEAADDAGARQEVIKLFKNWPLQVEIIIGLVEVQVREVVRPLDIAQELVSAGA